MPIRIAQIVEVLDYGIDHSWSLTINAGNHRGGAQRRISADGLNYLRIIVLIHRDTVVERRNRVEGRDRHALALPFVRQVEECLVFDNRATQRATELVISKGVFWLIGRVEKVSGV